ncbi:zinc finger protein 892-like [Acipenser ruthenus]|uniref:zinc finger protein 892-like n=1 Tax=Acipenser ruthenus TaxID=7906 RepID=UPI002740F769|nr:zinc finger protein 892-like [Acipenser ruthenus]XP_058874021.1 zinc finger protein 892-like [Acipenser ruthenus]
MDVSVSVSFFQDELASTIEHAVKAAVDTVLCEITKVVGGKFTEFQMEMAGKEKENESLKLRLEISESELKAVRECMNAADADIKQPLRNMNPDSNQQDFQRNENQRLFIRVKDIEERRAFNEAEEGPVIEAGQEDIFDQEWCGSIIEITGLTIVESIEILELEPVHIKEEAIELECDHITEEVSKENKVNMLEENIVKMESSPCDYCPSELVCMKPNQSVSEDTGSSVGEEGTVLGSIQRKHHPPQERAADGKEEGAMPSTSSTACAGVKLKQRWGVEPVHKKEEATELEPVYIKHHQQIHKSKKLYHCNECGRSFTQFGNLKIHKQVHTGEKRYKCNECSQSFTKLQCLKKHQRTHTGEKPYYCNECEKSFAVIGNLKKHQHIHKGEKPYHCTECEKTFSDLGNLKKHNRVHKGEKPYHCIECGKRFIQLGHLKKHQQIHLGDKPYHCTECVRCFKYLKSFKKHQRNHTAETS